jgi:hypothetical protein
MGHLSWRIDGGVATCDLSGHFWATITAAPAGTRTVWSWMIIGYENEVMAAGQTGDLSAAQRLVEAWDQWVRGPEDPAPVADECTRYQPVWPPWPNTAS